MFYAMKISVSVIDNVKSVVFWSFDKKQDRDRAVECNPTIYQIHKSDIPKGSNVKIFNGFRESWSGLFLSPVEK